MLYSIRLNRGKLLYYYIPIICITLREIFNIIIGTICITLRGNSYIIICPINIMLRENSNIIIGTICITLRENSYIIICPMNIFKAKQIRCPEAEPLVGSRGKAHGGCSRLLTGLKDGVLYYFKVQW
jgi:hypothetical protein